MTVFIAGGTTGIGYALAEHYLSKGSLVGICGRNPDKISDNVNNDLRIFKADVADYKSLSIAVEEFFTDQKKLDLFINCAGSYAEDVAGTISYEEAEEMLTTNILGTINGFEVARKIMRNQTIGAIAVIASVSGILDYPDSSLYTKTKRSVIQIADAYHRALKPHGISVTVIAPGYIKTEKLQQLNNNDLNKKPFLTDLKTATSLITTAIEKKEKLLIFPIKMKWLMRSLSVLPAPILNIIMSKKARWMKKN